MLTNSLSMTINTKTKIQPAKILDEWSSWCGCIDSHTAKYLIQSKALEGKEYQLITASIDLGMTSRNLKLTTDGLILPNIIENINEKSKNNNQDSEPLLASWDELDMIASKKQGCYALYDDDSKPWHISALSGNTGRCTKVNSNLLLYILIHRCNYLY